MIDVPTLGYTNKTVVNRLNAIVLKRKFNVSRWRYCFFNGGQVVSLHHQYHHRTLMCQVTSQHGDHQIPKSLPRTIKAKDPLLQQRQKVVVVISIRDVSEFIQVVQGVALLGVRVFC
jgi:hypothetical protein